MACVSEAIGLALPGSAGAPAPYESRDEYALRERQGGHAAARATASVRATSAPAKAFENAATIVAATGGSTNARAASAGHGARVPASTSTCSTVAEIFKRTPYIADLKPGGKYVAKDVFDIGGVPQIMRALLDGGYAARRLPDRHRQDASRRTSKA